MDKLCCVKQDVFLSGSRHSISFLHLMERSSNSNCILINGISENLTYSDLRRVISTQWHELRLRDVHRDGQYPSRAVAVFHDVIDASCDLKAQNLGENWTASIINQPADSIIVEANLTAATDKLKMLFSCKRQGGKKVKSVQQITATMFEVVFEGGWDAVISVCSRQWQAEGHVFTVYPNFTCFKEPVKKPSPQVLEPKKIPPPVPPKPKFRPPSLQIQESLEVDVSQIALKADPKPKFRPLSLQMQESLEVDVSQIALKADPKPKIRPPSLQMQESLEVDVSQSALKADQKPKIRPQSLQIQESLEVDVSQSALKADQKPKIRPPSLQIQESLKVDVSQLALKCAPNTDHCNNVDDLPTTESRDNVTRSLDTGESRRFKTIHNVPSIFSLLLRQLRFRQTVHEVCVNINIAVQHNEISLSGKRKNVKKFGAMLECEIQKLHELGDAVLTFLNHQDVQDELKQMISSSILLELTDTDVILKVKLNPDNQTVTFQDFVISIVEMKECFTIPNKDFENNPEWNDIRHRFDAAYSYRKLLIQEEKVVVLSLAQKIQDLDLIAKLLDFTCTAIAQKNVLFLFS